MSLSAYSLAARAAFREELLHRIGAAARTAFATLADLPRRAHDRAILRNLDHQMLDDLGRHRVNDEVNKPLWRG